MTTLDEQVALLMQGTEYGDEGLKKAMAAELRERLQEGRPLNVYCGYDPTAPDLHLGHTITMLKLKQFQDLGHNVTFLIGDHTTLVGDPSDKDKARPLLTAEEIRRNAATYADQAFRILDRSKTRVRRNSEWLAELRLEDLIRMGSLFTVQQFLTRENFRKRFDHGDPIFLHETLYALLQGYDAIVQETDVQVGGSDQLFNIIVAGRKLQEAMGQRPQIGIIMGILPGTDGVVRMSKSLGNHIAIQAPPEEMYGQVMSLPDAAMPIYFRLVTRYTPDRIAAVEKGLADGSLHPRDVKMELAFEIVDIFHGTEAAREAQEHFKTVFQRRELPPDMPEVKLAEARSLVDLLVKAELASSKSAARRLIRQGGVRLDGERVSDIDLVVQPGDAAILQVGKRRFLRLTTAE